LKNLNTVAGIYAGNGGFDPQNRQRWRSKSQNVRGKIEEGLSMRIGCTIFTNQHGNLCLRFYWNGRDKRESFGLKDTPDYRVQAEEVARLISAEINKGTFQYEKWFPIPPRYSYKPNRKIQRIAKARRRRKQFAYVKSLYPVKFFKIVPEQPRMYRTSNSYSKPHKHRGIIIADFGVYRLGVLQAIYEVGSLTHRDKLEFWRRQFPDVKIFWIPKCPADHMALVAIEYQPPAIIQRETTGRFAARKA
jgi:hypothetical protein